MLGMLPAATIIPKCNYFFPSSSSSSPPPTPGEQSRKGVNVPCIQVPDRHKNRNSSYDTELEKLETHIMIMASDRKMYF